MQNAAPRLPQRFNFAQHLLTLNEARGDKIAYRDDRCALSYADLADPKWKGKLGIEADDYDWFGSISHVVGEEQTRKTFASIF